jgi:hypothetical protein
MPRAKDLHLHEVELVFDWDTLPCKRTELTADIWIHPKVKKHVAATTSLFTSPVPHRQSLGFLVFQVIFPGSSSGLS